MTIEVAAFPMLMGEPDARDINPIGRGITPQMIQEAGAQGKRWKLLSGRLGQRRLFAAWRPRWFPWILAAGGQLPPLSV